MNSTFECKLASFDLDGTLVRDTSTGGFLAEKLGHAKAMAEAEALYAQGAVPNDYVSTLDGKFYEGLSKAEVFEWLEDLPFIDGIAETVKAFNAQGIPCVICTLAWEFVAEFVAQKYGFVSWSGPALAYDKDGRFTGNIASHFNEFGKPVFIQNTCDEMGINMANVFHIGDSRSDIELFKQAGFTVAINATADAKAAARVSIETNTLADVLPLIPNLKALV
jgi:phosphoserine phosphatase